ncbi:MAG: hypothetical protein LUH06_02635 [Oscillospiraceae bacterium]|nr:hypothetical protein [Oscillospiraceae bacterium]
MTQNDNGKIGFILSKTPNFLHFFRKISRRCGENVHALSNGCPSGSGYGNGSIQKIFSAVFDVSIGEGERFLPPVLRLAYGLNSVSGLTVLPFFEKLSGALLFLRLISVRLRAGQQHLLTSHASGNAGEF